MIQSRVYLQAPDLTYEANAASTYAWPANMLVIMAVLLLLVLCLVTAVLRCWCCPSKAVQVEEDRANFKVSKPAKRRVKRRVGRTTAVHSEA